MDHLSDLIETATQSDQQAGNTSLVETIRSLDVDLGTLARDAGSRFEDIYNDGQFSREDERALYALGDVVDAISAVQNEREQSRAQAAELANRVRSAVPPTDGEAVAQDQDKPAEQDGDDQQAEEPNSTDHDVEKAEEAPETGDAAEVDAATVPDVEHAEPPQHIEEPATPPAVEIESVEQSSEQQRQGELVAASARPNTAAAVKATQQHHSAASGSPAPARQASPLRRVSITAAADVPDTPTGKNLSMRDLAVATANRFRDMPLGQGGVGVIKSGIANINRHFAESITADGYDSATAAVVDRVADERRLPGGSLVAAAKLQLENAQRALTASAPLPTPPGDVWCAPSEQDFSLCPPLATREGILDLPGLGLRRPGIRYPVVKQYPDQHRPPEHGDPDNDQRAPGQPPRHDWHGYYEPYDGGNLSNPNYFVENPKKCIEGPCVEWAEERMSLSYLCITGDILREYGYPELTERFISDALISHDHFLNEQWIRRIVSRSDRLAPFDASTPTFTNPAGGPAVPPGPLSPPWPSPTAGQAPPPYLDTTNSYWPGSPVDVSSLAKFAMGSAAEAVIERIGSLVTWFKDAYRTSFSASWDGFAPYWLREFLKLDIERKGNRPHGLPVSNAEIDALFLMWGVRMQWVYDWQSYPSIETPDGARVMPADGWPNAVDIVLYPAGSWVMAQQEVLRISGQYDSTKLAQNKYTALFMEDGHLLLNRCNRSFVIELRNLCANGAIGARRDACVVNGGGGDNGGGDGGNGGGGSEIASLEVAGDAAVTVGETTALTASASTADGFSKDVTAEATWTSSDEGVATVDGGTVTGVAAGTATITATYQGQEDTAEVTVSDAAAAASTSGRRSRSS